MNQHHKKPTILINNHKVYQQPLEKPTQHLTRLSEGKLDHRVNKNSNMIYKSISDAQKLSIQLLSIIDRISLSSQNIHTSSKNPVVQKIQKDLTLKFQEILNLVRQFYHSIQERLKMINSCQQEKSFDNFAEITRMALEDNRYQFLNDKIKTLQSSLGETKKNQSKLLEIIEKLIEKYQIPESSIQLQGNQRSRKRQRAITCNYHNQLPILRQEDEFSYKNQLAEGQNKTEEYSRQYNISNVQSIYHQLYDKNHILDATGDQMNKKSSKEQPYFRLRQIEQNTEDQIYIKKLYSKLPYSYTDSKKSLKMDIKSSATSNSRTTAKNPKDSQSTKSKDDKDHRMQFMIGNLKP